MDALRRGAIAAASLDVFETKPLPADRPFWDLEQVQVSAHMSGDVVGWQDELADQFQEFLGRWVGGEMPANVVDKATGYVPRGGRS